MHDNGIRAAFASVSNRAAAPVISRKLWRSTQQSFECTLDNLYPFLTLHKFQRLCNPIHQRLGNIMFPAEITYGERKELVFTSGGMHEQID